MNNILIEDYTIIKTDVIKSINISLISIELKKNAMFKIEFNDINGNVCKIEFLKLENEDYLSWYNDDEYIINYILNKFNLSKK